MFLRFPAFFVLLLFAATLAFSQSITVPVSGNTYSNLETDRRSRLSDKGISGWKSPEEIFTTYVRLSSTGRLNVKLNASATDSNNLISVTINSRENKIQIDKKALSLYDAGTWDLTDTGYIAIRIKGISKKGGSFANIESIELSGPAIKGETNYVKNNEGNFYYWGRRGPSVHLNYTLPKSLNAEWFYNEVTVPKGNDVTGSFFMANGFGQGYFGMQVNSSVERRILFSVWSPFQTDDPKQIPDDKKIILLKKGEGVYTGEFGNEGSGGQSFLKYSWRAGETYKFLLHGVPASNNHTIFTAYFFDPDVNRWLLIASFKRPGIATYLTNTHSFLENFIPQQGKIMRKVYFSNQWIADEKGTWHELMGAGFTFDNTGRVGYRKDYAGGAAGKNFYLQNCGFFNSYSQYGKKITRQSAGRPPVIDFNKLP